ncbi:uncharacterized protein PG998_014635 [Apiospora kogelbergensis]|uniref:uncharacterized protein n=1 Tax=Apiospora kogelbergensis TaxID=1337665 RepID=UPI003131F705
MSGSVWHAWRYLPLVVRVEASGSVPATSIPAVVTAIPTISIISATTIVFFFSLVVASTVVASTVVASTAVASTVVAPTVVAPTSAIKFLFSLD